MEINNKTMIFITTKLPVPTNKAITILEGKKTEICSFVLSIHLLYFLDGIRFKQMSKLPAVRDTDQTSKTFKLKFTVLAIGQGHTSTRACIRWND